MSAHLTIYTMAIEAERPLRLQEANRERLAAQAEAASRRSTDPILRRLSQLLRRSCCSGVTTVRAAVTGLGRRSVIGQPIG
jgi:hypothetical protein